MVSQSFSSVIPDINLGVYHGKLPFTEEGVVFGESLLDISSRLHISSCVSCIQYTLLVHDGVVVV